MRELRLGIFVFIGTVLLAVGILTLGEVRLEKGYRIHILFSDIGGLLEKAPVRIAGVEVGTVKDITLEKNKAKVTVWLKEKIRVYEDATASIITSGVVGMKYLDITRGDEHKRPLEDGNVIIGIDPVSFDRVVNQTMKSFDQLVATLQSITAGGEVPENLNRVLKDIHGVASKIDKFLDEEKETMGTIVGNTAELSKGLIHLTDRIYGLVDNLDSLAVEGKKELKGSSASLKASSEKLNQTLEVLTRLGKNFETQISTTTTPAGKLLSDKKFAQDLEKTITTFNELLEGIKKKFKL